MDSSIPHRRYHSPRRQAQADATRRRILDAAQRLFTESGFAAVTMDAIARAAGVSVATVYLNFSGRTVVVEALVDEVTSASDLNVEQVVEVRDPVERAHIGARIIRTLNERSWPITDILRSAQGSDASLTALWHTWQERHLYAMRRAVQILADNDMLRPGIDAGEAVDILYAVAGTEVYRALVRERGWTPEHYEDWLFRTLCRELLS